jgi:Metal-dependent hydrolase
LTCSVLVLAGTGCTRSTDQLRVMTYNIHHGTGMDGVLDLPRIARVIKAFSPDFVILNEVDQATGRSFGTYQADSLARLTGLFATFGRSIDFDGGEYGNALLSRHPPDTSWILDLSVDNTMEGRSALVTVFQQGSIPIMFMGAHLGLDSAERVDQVEEILRFTEYLELVILAGDFNFEPGTDTYLALTRHFADTWPPGLPAPPLTFPADEPRKRIDFILYKGPVSGSRPIPPGHPAIAIASDHRPVIAEIAF